MASLFYRTGNFVSCTIKTLRDDAHSRAEKMSAELTTPGAQKQIIYEKNVIIENEIRKC